MCNAKFYIKSVQKSGGQQSNINVTAIGELKKNEDSYKMTYDEPEEDGFGSSRTTITVDGQRVVVIKSGKFNTQLIFDGNKPYATSYNTPFGTIDINLTPTLVKTDVDDEEGSIDLEYILNVAGAQYVSKLNLRYVRRDNI